MVLELVAKLHCKYCNKVSLTYLVSLVCFKIQFGFISSVVGNFIMSLPVYKDHAYSTARCETPKMSDFVYIIHCLQTDSYF